MKRFAIVLGVAMSIAVTASAQEVGTVAAVDGAAEIQHDGGWTPSSVGDPVFSGDTLRTGTGGRMRVVFQDDSVLNVGEDSEIVVDEQVFRPSGASTSLMQLLRGQVRALVGAYYERQGSTYEIETPTAVSGVRGTEFVVSYDPTVDVTKVIGVTGRVEVHSVLDRVTHGVYVTAGEITSVEQGKYPSPPPRLDEHMFRQYLEGLQFIGAGRSESLTVGHPVLGGTQVPAPDRAPAPMVGRTVQDRGQHDASSLVEQPPSVVKDLTGELGIRF
jgi:hypothetical protein